MEPTIDPNIWAAKVARGGSLVYWPSLRSEGEQEQRKLGHASGHRDEVHTPCSIARVWKAVLFPYKFTYMTVLRTSQIRIRVRTEQ